MQELTQSAQILARNLHVKTGMNSKRPRFTRRQKYVHCISRTSNDAQVVINLRFRPLSSTDSQNFLIIEYCPPDSPGTTDTTSQKVGVYFAHYDEDFPNKTT